MTYFARSISPLRFKLVALVLLLLVAPSHAQDASSADGAQATPPKLRVGTKVSPPFAVKRVDGSWSGISIELWRQIAGDLGVEYEFYEYEIPTIIDKLEAGELDAGVAAISITAQRDERIDFSHSYYATGLGVAVLRQREPNLWRLTQNLLTGRLLIILGSLALMAVVAGLIFWYFERKNNEGLFGGRPTRGMSMGVWWATIMLLGHKGVIPSTAVSKFLAVVVMITSTVVVSVLTGVIASAITVAQIGLTVRHPDDLRHFRIATVASTTSVDYLRERHLNFQEAATVELAIESLVSGAADAVVYDLGMLKYQRSRNFTGAIEVLPIRFNEQLYAVGIPPESPLREDLNRALLTYTASDAWSDVLYRYLGE